MAKVSERVASFAAAAGSLGVAALLTRACPGGCSSCTTCAASIVPMGSAVGAVGLAIAGSALVRARTRDRAKESGPAGG